MRVSNFEFPVSNFKREVKTPGKAKPIPEGFHTLTPHLIIRDAKRAIDFYKRAFGAQPLGPAHFAPDGKVMHATLKIGDGARSPQSLGGSPVTINIYTDDVDRLFNQAVSAGATIAMPLKDQFWGDRYGTLADPFGHKWSLCTHIEDVAPEELEKRAKAAFAEMAKKGEAGKPGSAVA